MPAPSIFSADWRNELLKWLTAAFQPLSAALTSWAGVTRASGFDTFAATPSSANLAALLTDGSASWTPQLAFGGASTGITYSLNTAVVRKVGSFVLIAGTIILSNKGSATGAATITGLPVTSANITATGTAGSISVMLNMASIPGTPISFIGANSAVLNLGYWPSAGGARANFDNTHFNNNSQVNFNLLYISV